MPTATGANKPTDIIGSALVEGWWPEDTAIASAKAFEQAFLSQIGVQQVRADEVEQARRTIRNSLQSEHDDAMHQKLAEISRQQDQIPEYARDIAETTRMMINQCEGAQRALLGIVEEYRTVIENLCRQGNYLYAAVQFWTARAEVAAEIVEAQSYIETWGDKLISRLPAPPPAGWMPGSAAPASNGSHDGGAPGRVEAVNNTTIKQDGSIGSGSGRLSGDPERSGSSATEDDPAHSQKESNDSPKPGRRNGNPEHSEDGDSGNDSAASVRAGDNPAPGRLSGSPERSPAAATTPPTSLGGGSGSGLGGSSGMTSPASGLGGLGKSPMDAGLGGAVKPPMSSLPSTAPAGGGGAGSGSGRLGSGGVPSVPPAAPVTAIAPPAPALSSSAATPAGSPTPGFGSNSPVAQSAPHPPGPVGGTMGGMPAGGAMAAPVTPPPASPVGPAPTQSPGLAQGAAAASPAAATSGAATNVTSTTPVAAASFSTTAPERIDRYAQMAIDAVKTLTPAIIPVPGLVLAAAVVGSQGSPQIVITTNDGDGWLPEGFFLPPNMLHALVDLNFHPDYREKWFGWADPARALIDYVEMRNQQSDQRPVNLLGLASMGPLSEQTKTTFPGAVPSVSAERDAQPLTADRGRNAHRLKVLDREYYDYLRQSSQGTRDKMAISALRATMATPAVQPVRDIWETIDKGKVTDEEATKAQIAQRYQEALVMCGAYRPGFTNQSYPGEGIGGIYEKRFREVRAMETLVLFILGRPVEDIIYAAAAAGADFAKISDDQRVWA